MASKETQGSLLLVAALAGTVGVVAFVAFLVLGGFGLNPAAFMAILIALVVSVFLYRGMHSKPPHPNDARPGPVGGTAAGAAAKPGVATESASTGSAAASTASVSAAPAASGTATTSASHDASAASAPAAGAGSATAATGVGAAQTDAKPAAAPASTGASASATSQAEAPAKSDSAPAEAPAKADSAPAASPTQADPTPADQPSGTGQAAGTAPADVSEDDKPEMMSAPREGGPDNLKEIKGVGPKLETMLHGMGIYHFDQISKWTERELAWVDQNLQGFKGRATRDNWVSQAKTLADGGETEFSKRVDKGGVY